MIICWSKLSHWSFPTCQLLSHRRTQHTNRPKVRPSRPTQLNIQHRNQRPRLPVPDQPRRILTQRTKPLFFLRCHISTMILVKDLDMGLEHLAWSIKMDSSRWRIKTMPGTMLSCRKIHIGRNSIRMALGLGKECSLSEIPW